MPHVNAGFAPLFNLAEAGLTRKVHWSNPIAPIRRDEIFDAVVSSGPSS